MANKKKKKWGGRPFVKGVKDDPRANKNGQPATGPSPPRFREPKSVFDNIAKQMNTIPPGATLRPYEDRTAPKKCETLSQNWLVDEKKLFEATNHAMQSHGKTKSRLNHIPMLQKHSENKVGLGVQVTFRCGFKNCQFVSQTYELFVRAESGQPLPNLQVGVALSKTDLTL